MSAFVCLKFDSVSIRIEHNDSSPMLSEFITQHRSHIVDSKSQYSLSLQEKVDGLHLSWSKENGKPLNFYIDVLKVVNQLRSYPAPKQGAFNQALGKKSHHILDATGGWGGDALLMCTQGYRVSVLERNPIMAMMLQDAMCRLAQSDWAISNQINTPKVSHSDAVSYFLNKESVEGIDCVYLDPMFPPKKKKKAAVNKQMQLLQWMVGQDIDADNLVQNALTAGVPRVAVKRPDYAEPLFRKPFSQFSSKLVHYDVYLSSK